MYTLLPCAVGSWNSSDHHGKLSPLFPFCVTFLSSANFIPVTSYMSSIHLLLGRSLLLSPSPCASIIPFSNPSDRITCPNNPSFLLIAVCCSFSSSSFPISNRTFSLVFFSVNDILCISLHIHISHALIFFTFSLSLSTSHSHTKLSGKSVTSLSFLSYLCSHVCLVVTFLVQSL